MFKAKATLNDLCNSIHIGTIWIVNVEHLGGMAEWSIAPVLKTGGLVRGPGVRIPLPPQYQQKQKHDQGINVGK